MYMEGVERIKILASEVEDKPLLKIVEYLLSRTDMNDKYLNEEKSLKQMISYIKGEAKKQSKNGVAMIEDEEVYGWAIHYWDETNEALGITKKETVEEIKEHNKKEEEKYKAIKKEQKLSNKANIEEKKKIQPEGQLTLFDFL